jgi:hypothetical protein
MRAVEEITVNVALVLLILGLWASMSFCMARFAKRAGVGPVWVAWIPLANFALFLKAARRPLWWFVLFFVPVVNIVIYFKVQSEACRSVGESGWLCVPLNIPIVHLGAYAVLAGFRGPSMAKALGAMLLLAVILPAAPIVAVMVWHGQSFGSVESSLRALESENAGVRREAMVTLQNKCPKSPQCVPALLAAWDKADKDLRRPIMSTFGNIGADAAPAVPRLMEEAALLKRPDVMDLTGPIAAVETLGRIGPRAAEALPLLRELAKERHGEEAKQAIAMIEKR